MSLLITGSSGIIGSRLKELLKLKYDIIDLDINTTPSIDSTDEKSVKHFFESIKEKKIKYIINCVGIPDKVPLTTKNILDIDIDYFKKMIDINLNSIFILIKECYRHNRDSLTHIINISSLYSIVSPRNDLYNGHIKNPAYTASKHGLVGLTKHLAVIMAQDNIKLNCIAPGGVTESINDNDFITKYISNVPLKKTISINEIKNTIEYLFNTESITGQNIVIDGGYSIL